LSVPADHGLGADKEQSLAPSRPKPRKQGPEHPVGALKVDSPSGALALEDEQPVAKGEDLSVERSSGPEKRAERCEKGQEGRGKHRRHVDSTR